MNTIKRFLAVFLSVLLIISLVTVTGLTTSATDSINTDTVTVTLKSKQGIFDDVTEVYNKGDEFEVAIFWENKNLLRGGQLSTYLNNTGLRVIDHEKNPLLSSSYSNIGEELQLSESLVTVNFSEYPGVDFTQKNFLIKYKVKVLDTAASAETLLVDIEELYGNTAEDVVKLINFVTNSEVCQENIDQFSVEATLSDGISIPEPTSASSESVPSDSSDNSDPSQSEPSSESDSSTSSDSTAPTESDSSNSGDSTPSDPSDSITPSDNTDPTESDSTPTGTTGTSGNGTEGKVYIVNTGNYDKLTVVIYDILNPSPEPFKTIECEFDENGVCEFDVNIEMKFTVYNGSELLFSSYFEAIAGKYISTETFGIYDTLEDAENAEPIVTEPTEPSTAKPTTPKKPAFKVTKKTLEAGQTYTLSVVNANGKKASGWKSSKTKVATVSSKGKVTALGKGKATIYATVGGTKIKCTITVSSSPKIYNGKKAVKNNKTIKVKKGKTLKLTIKGKASGVNNIYKTSNKKLAKVISKKSVKTIKIKAYKKGTAKVTITVNKKYKTTIKVKVV